MNQPEISLEPAVGPYRLVRRLGEGGMGIVWLGYDPALARHVAVKVLRAPAHPSVVRRFLREAQATARLDHPNIIIIHHIGTQPTAEGDWPFIVMEYLEGGSLADEIHLRGPLPWRRAAEAARDAAAALACAHAAGIVHRDLKPANLLRHSLGHVKLVDFGLARLVFSDPDLSYPGVFVGSPSYAAPEQADPAGTVDHRCDLYGLACTLFALLTGRPPFPEEDVAAVLRHHRQDPFPEVRRLAPEGVPEGLVEVLARASRKRPEERYGSAEEMRGALEAVLKGCSGGGSDLAGRRSEEMGGTREGSEDTGGTGLRTVQTRGTHGSRGVRAGESTVRLAEQQLIAARSRADGTAEVAALVNLYKVHTRAGRTAEAEAAARQALAAHLRMRDPFGREMEKI